jgi:hypothetical protein
MGRHQAFGWRSRKQCLECGYHRFLYYPLRCRNHSFFRLDDKFVVHLKHDLRFARQSCAHSRIDADQGVDRNFRRRTLDR